MKADEVVGLIAQAAMAADDTALRRAIAFVLNACDQELQGADKDRMVAEHEQLSGRRQSSDMFEARAAGRENTAALVEQALVEAFDLHLLDPEDDP
ncbi:hypothetical protein [Actinoallomurus sp. NPDC052274]|uniref:hypothetical protein n=1 Tax=Actinoallomurus sp. NPDC052274 TaxID=3155420 RepID=UPI003436DB44